MVALPGAWDHAGGDLFHPPPRPTLSTQLLPAPIEAPLLLKLLRHILDVLIQVIFGASGDTIEGAIQLKELHKPKLSTEAI